jgi:hypothetical protein
MQSRATRRGFFGTAARIGAGAAVLGSASAGAAHVAALQADGQIVGEAVPPQWRFVVHSVQDPYTGELHQPDEPEEGVRYIGADIEIRNESQQPLNVSPTVVRSLDIEGRQYPSGEVQGAEVALVHVNLLPGEVSRGWVWFGVPDAAQITGMVYVAPAPRLHVPLLDVIAPPGDATPGTDG